MIFPTKLFSHSSIRASWDEIFMAVKIFLLRVTHLAWNSEYCRFPLCSHYTFQYFSDYLEIAKRLGKLHHGSQVKMRSPTPVEIATEVAEGSGQKENHLSFTFPLLQKKNSHAFKSSPLENHKTPLNNSVMQNYCYNSPGFVFC